MPGQLVFVKFTDDGNPVFTDYKDPAGHLCVGVLDSEINMPKFEGTDEEIKVAQKVWLSLTGERVILRDYTTFNEDILI